MGSLEQACTGPIRAGERPALVAKQLTLQQGFRDGGAVDGDHRDHDAPVGGVALSNLEATPQLQPGEEVHRTRGGSVIGLPFREKHASPNG